MRCSSLQIICSLRLRWTQRQQPDDLLPGQSNVNHSGSERQVSVRRTKGPAFLHDKAVFMVQNPHDQMVRDHDFSYLEFQGGAEI